MNKELNLALSRQDAERLVQCLRIYRVSCTRNADVNGADRQYWLDRYDWADQMVKRIEEVNHEPVL